MILSTPFYTQKDVVNVARHLLGKVSYQPRESNRNN